MKRVKSRSHQWTSSSFISQKLGLDQIWSKNLKELSFKKSQILKALQLYFQSVQLSSSLVKEDGEMTMEAEREQHKWRQHEEVALMAIRERSTTIINGSMMINDVFDIIKR